MWHGVPFACQRRPIVGVLRTCWLLPGSFDCFCCPHTSVHRPSIACLAVFLCGPGARFLHALSGPSTICPFPPHGWSAPDGLPLKQPIWAAGDTPHLMPVEHTPLPPLPPKCTGPKWPILTNRHASVQNKSLSAVAIHQFVFGRLHGIVLWWLGPSALDAGDVLGRQMRCREPQPRTLF